MDQLSALRCFLDQEKYIPKEDFKHQILLFVIQDISFTIILKKAYGEDLLALQIPYLSTCNQMKTMYYDLLEPSDHKYTKDGNLLWSIPEDKIPTLGNRIIEHALREKEQPFSPGPTQALKGRIWDSASEKLVQI